MTAPTLLDREIGLSSVSHDEKITLIKYCSSIPLRACRCILGFLVRPSNDPRPSCGEPFGGGANLTLGTRKRVAAFDGGVIFSPARSEDTRMAYSVAEINDLKAEIDLAMASGRLNAWQMKFLTDIRDRIAKYGTKVRLSEKQVNKLGEIIGTGRSRGKVTLLRPNGQSSRPRWRRKCNMLLAREGHRLVNRFVRNFAFAAALIVGLLVYWYAQQTSVPTASGHFSSLSRSYSTLPITRGQFTVTDGDTIHTNGEAKGLRLVGFNAPETFKSKCARELELGNRATARLREIVAASNLELQRIPCACAPGTEGTDACNYGRKYGILLANGRDVGRTLISEGLAVPFACGSTTCPPTPRPWCS
jgi:micrococcal nuclease